MYYNLLRLRRCQVLMTTRSTQHCVEFDFKAEAKTFQKVLPGKANDLKKKKKSKGESSRKRQKWGVVRPEKPMTAVTCALFSQTLSRNWAW